MILLWHAEWLRFKRNRSNLFVILACAAILAASGIWSGYAAKAMRDQINTATMTWHSQIATAASAAAGSSDPAKIAIATYKLARDFAPPAHLPPLGGLVLSTSRFDILPSNIRAGIESRYADSRKSEAISNPLLTALGMLDFSTVTALLLPLFVIGLTYGLIQEDREQGRWRLVCAQMHDPWKILLPALAIRFLAVVLTIGCASACAFLIDPSSSATAFFEWLMVVTACTVFWLALCGLSTLLPLSSGAVALALIGIWIATSFILPATFSSLAQPTQAMPSRLESIATLRVIQQETEHDSEVLLAAWYADHPLTLPVLTTHTWPVSFVPRYLEQDKQLRPLMAQFDHSRAKQLHAMQGWSWLSPSLAMIAAADALAGISADHYQTYIQQVNSFEDKWRDFFVPKIMGYQSLNSENYQTLPQFFFEDQTPTLPDLNKQTIAVMSSAGLFLMLIFIFRTRLRMS